MAVESWHDKLVGCYSGAYVSQAVNGDIVGWAVGLSGHRKCADFSGNGTAMGGLPKRHVRNIIAAAQAKLQ